VMAAEAGDSGSSLRAAPDALAMFLWLVRLRWLAIGGVGLVLSIGGALDILPQGSTRALWVVLAGLTVYNAWLRFGVLSSAPRIGFTGQIVVDCLALALFVHFAGGIENPFFPLFVLHVVNANIVLRPQAASAILLLAIGLAAGVVLGEGSGLLTHYCLYEAGPRCWGASIGVPSLAALGGLILTFIASAFFARHLTGRLQDSERRLTAAVHDLFSEKRQLAETRSQIERERSRLQSIMDCMGDAITFSDLDGRLRLANERARDIQRVAGPLADSALSGSAALQRILAAGDGPGALVPPRYDRGGRTFEATVAVVRDAQGEPMGTVTVERDITDRLALEQRLMHEERMAVVGKLAAAVAHEINNPIGVVSLYAQHALARLPADHPIERHLHVIRRNAESCRKIIGDLLGLARTRQPQRRAVDLREICRDVARAVEPMAVRRGVQLSDAAGDGDAAPLWIDGDADQLYQAALNLAVNAVEACGEADRVTLRAGEAAAADGVVRIIEVRDTGPGIPAAERERIFHPFYSTKPDGTGLGLAVADNIVKSHGGHIAVENASPRGTVFCMRLPAAAPDPVTTPAEAARAADAVV